MPRPRTIKALLAFGQDPHAQLRERLVRLTRRIHQTRKVLFGRTREVALEPVGHVAEGQHRRRMAFEPVGHVGLVAGLVAALGKDVVEHRLGHLGGGAVRRAHGEARRAQPCALHVVGFAPPRRRLEAKEHGLVWRVLGKVGQFLVHVQAVAHQHYERRVRRGNLWQRFEHLPLLHHGKEHVSRPGLGERTDHLRMVARGAQLHHVMDAQPALRERLAPRSTSYHAHVVSGLDQRMCQIATQRARAKDDGPHACSPPPMRSSIAASTVAVHLLPKSHSSCCMSKRMRSGSRKCRW